MTPNPLLARPFERLEFFVAGKPQPGGSKRVFMNKATGAPIVTDAAVKNKDWRLCVREDAMKAYTQAPTAMALQLEVTFYVLRPRGHYGAKGLKPSAPKYPAIRPDCTKLLRSTEDALSGILWRDDAQIVLQIVRKVYGDRTGALIIVSPAT